VLRGEPLVPLSDVSFAEAAGRVTAVARPHAEPAPRESESEAVPVS
jgi:hypothetical protein